MRNVMYDWSMLTLIAVSQSHCSLNLFVNVTLYEVSSVMGVVLRS
jgi:hypothetical protein